MTNLDKYDFPSGSMWSSTPTAVNDKTRINSIEMSPFVGVSEREPFKVWRLLDEAALAQDELFFIDKASLRGGVVDGHPSPLADKDTQVIDRIIAETTGSGTYPSGRIRDMAPQLVSALKVEFNYWSIEFRESRAEVETQFSGLFKTRTYQSTDVLWNGFVLNRKSR